MRLLRVAAGLTQTELAGDRFSKEYVSQIERGKTRPTVETVEWLAQRLDVDPVFLSSGVSTDERSRVEALLARAEALSKAYRYKDAVEAYAEARAAVSATNSVELEVRTRSGEAWARMQEGDVRAAVELLNGARATAEGSIFSDVDRAELVFRLGVARYKLSSVSTAVALLDEALMLAERSDLPCDGLRSDIYHWRSRCHRRQRDFEAAREDVEHALELAQGVDDRRKMADAYFQASLVAERTGHWLLSRNYAERAKNLFQELDDERTVGRLLNNLGGLEFLLGKPDEAIARLNESLAIALEHGTENDAATTISSLAQGVDDRRKMADAYFQASLVAERTGHWVLSRNYAERAKNLFQELDDERTVGRLLNNLGGLSLLLGKPHQAIEQLKASFAVAVEVDSKGDAAQAMGGLATVHLRLGEWEAAEEHARQALQLLEGREDFLDEIGQSQLVLGRSLLERDRLDEAEESFRAADATFEQFSSISHRANVWVALGDLAARRGQDTEAARLYRNAAEALQDMRF